MKFEGQASSSSDGSGNKVAKCPNVTAAPLKAPSSYACDNDDCKFREFQGNVQKEISIDEAKKILNDGSELIEDFISRESLSLRIWFRWQ